MHEPPRNDWRHESYCPPLSAALPLHPAIAPAAVRAAAIAHLVFIFLLRRSYFGSR
jgi:hypothetical protein